MHPNMKNALQLLPFDSLRADIRDAWRGLRRDPGFTLVAVGIVTAVLTANLLLFAFLDAFFLRRLPIAAAERHFELAIQDEKGAVTRGWAFRDVEALLANSPAVIESAYALADKRVIVGGREQRSYAEAVTPSYFELLKPALAAGRVPGLGAGNAREAAILLSDSGWKRLTNSDPNAIGSTLLLNGATFTVVGRMAAGAGGLEPVTPDFWMLAGMENLCQAQLRSERATPANVGCSANDESSYIIGGLLRAGVSAEQAAAALTPVVAALDSDAFHHDSPRRALVELRPTYLRERRELQPMALVLVALFGVVTLIAGANLTNLYLARAAARRRDLAIRAALGATRARMIRHIVTESLMLASLAAVAAWAISVSGIAWLQGTVFSLVSDAGMSMRPVDVDLRVFTATLIVAVLIGAGCALTPALHVTRGQLEGALRRDARWLSGRVSAGRLRGALVIAQIALSLPLLVGAGILVSSAVAANSIDVDYEIDHLVDLRADRNLPQIQARLRNLPGVTAVSAAGFTPLTGSMPRANARVDGVATGIGINHVDEQFLSTVGIPLRWGRGFHAHEAAAQSRVAIISQTTARRLFPGGGNPLGRTLELQMGDDEQFRAHEIVGVTADVMSGLVVQGEDGRDATAVYIPASLESGATTDLLVRLRRADAAAIGGLRDACAAVGAFCEPYTLRRVLGMQRTAFVVGSQVASSLGMLALGLACLGLYGLARFAVTQRTREFGVRVALGATRTQILQLVLGESARRSGWGIALGLPVAIALGVALAALLPFFRSFHVAAYIGVPAILMGCALLASLGPALRAAATDPMIVLREE